MRRFRRRRNIRPGDGQRDGQQHDRQRRAVAEVELGERGAVGVEVEDLGRRARAAAGGREDRRKRRQRRHRAQDDHHDDRRPDQRQRDVAKALPGAGPVEPRRLVDVGRQCGERRQQHEEGERRPLPGVDGDHRDQRELRVAEPVVAAQAERVASRGRRGRSPAPAPACARTGRRRPGRARSAGSRRCATGPDPSGSAARAARAQGRSRPAATTVDAV